MATPNPVRPLERRVALAPTASGADLTRQIIGDLASRGAGGRL